MKKEEIPTVTHLEEAFYYLDRRVGDMLILQNCKIHSDDFSRGFRECSRLSHVQRDGKIWLMFYYC